MFAETDVGGGKICVFEKKRESKSQERGQKRGIRRLSRQVAALVKVTEASLREAKTVDKGGGRSIILSILPLSRSTTL